MADCGTLTVEAAFDPSLVEVSACTSDDLPGTVNPGDSVSVRVFLDNGNEVAAAVDVALLLNGTQVDLVENVGVPATGGQTGVTITAPSETGDYDAEAVKASTPEPTSEPGQADEARVARTDGGKTDRIRRLDTGCSSCGG